jgi:hypothetical protein
MKLDRTMQYEILTQLSDIYPSDFMVNDLTLSVKEDLQSNLFYLSEHNLIEPVINRTGNNVNPTPTIITAKITAKGLDFLEADGGISAILSTITVKFDAENIRSLIHDKIMSSELPPEKKMTLVKKLKEFSGEVLKTVALKLIEQGLENPSFLNKILNIGP